MSYAGNNPETPPDCHLLLRRVHECIELRARVSSLERRALSSEAAYASLVAAHERLQVDYDKAMEGKP